MLIPKHIYKGIEPDNIRETWVRSEREQTQTGNPPKAEEKPERLIEENALEYAEDNEEERAYPV